MKTKLLAAVLICFFVFGNTVFAQKENYVWYFGDSAGVDFNSGAPIALTNGVTATYEGTSTISDANGNLLFYTDGITVWDSTHTQMPNGDSLGGGWSSTQSALIIPFPGNNQMYYIFTVGECENPPINFNYSIVDMSLNGGNGDVTLKNILIKTPVTEKLTAVKHANGNDIWVMVHGDSDSLFAYLITPGGISLNPIVSKIGQMIALNVAFAPDASSYMKFSPDGTKLAFAATLSGYVDLFDFDANTGIVTNEKYLPAGSYVYGLEFSPNGNFLYCTRCIYQYIYQWDISSNIDSIINSTFQSIGYTSSSRAAALQLGPDGKIYVARVYDSFLGRINYPDSAGPACNYVDYAAPLAGKICNLGLPNFITSYFLPTGINTNNPPQNQLTISPNPATDKITISFPATTSENITIKIFSITGEVVFEKLFQSFRTLEKLNAAIDVTGFSNGIYFLNVQTEKDCITKKIMVQH